MSARPRPGSWIGWVLTAVAAVSIVGGVLFLEAGLSADGDDVILEVEDAVASVPPSTVAPVREAAIPEVDPEPVEPTEVDSGDGTPAGRVTAEVRELREPEEATAPEPSPSV